MTTKTIRNVRIENFQSHELTELAFDDGLNVIVGASDTGKSAVIRALRWLLFNEPRGSDFIRVGASQCRVSIELADGARVTRERTASKNRYIVVQADGTEQVYEGFGNSVPHEVCAVTGVAKVMLDEDHESTLHLGTQLEPPFLLSEPGSIKAKAIGRLNGVHIIDAASRDTHRDLTRLVQDEKAQHQQLAEAEAELEQFSDLPYLENILLLVEEKQNELKKKIAGLERLQLLRKRYADVQGQLGQVQRVLVQTEQLDRAALQTERAVALHSKTLRLQQMRHKLDQVAEGLLHTDVILRQTAGLDHATNSLQRSEHLFRTHQRLRKLAELRDQVRLGKQRVDAVLLQTDQLEQAEHRVQRIAGAQERYARLLSLRGKRQETDQVLHQVDRVIQQTTHVADAERKLERLVQKRQQMLLLQELYGKHEEIARHLQEHARHLQALRHTERAEFALEQMAMLHERQKRLEQMNRDLLDVEVRLQKADVYMRENAEEMRQKLAEYSRELKLSGTCPVCLTPIDEHTTERLVEEFRGGLER